jgi:hypothetical protein
MPPVADDGMPEQWRHVLNVVVPPAAMWGPGGPGRPAASGRGRGELIASILREQDVGCVTFELNEGQ